MVGSFTRESPSFSILSFWWNDLHVMGLAPATSPCNKSQGLVALCELATIVPAGPVLLCEFVCFKSCRRDQL